MPSCTAPNQTASLNELIPKQVRGVAFRILVISADSLQLKVFTCQALQQEPLCVLNEETLTIARPSRSGSELSELPLSLGAKRGPCPRPPEANSWSVVTRRKWKMRVGTERCRRGPCRPQGSQGTTQLQCRRPLQGASLTPGDRCSWVDFCLFV